jgi:hypothetical protein
MFKKLTTAAAMTLIASSFAFAGQGRPKPLDKTGFVTQSPTARASAKTHVVKKHHAQHKKLHRSASKK